MPKERRSGVLRRNSQQNVVQIGATGGESPAGGLGGLKVATGIVHQLRIHYTAAKAHAQHNNHKKIRNSCDEHCQTWVAQLGALGTNLKTVVCD